MDKKLNESILATTFHPFKSSRIRKAVERVLDDLWNTGIFEEYKVNKMLGFFKLYPDKENKKFFYKVSITGFNKSDAPEATSVRKFTKEKLEFVGKIKSPFKFFKVKDHSLYHIFETLIETMADDLKSPRLMSYVSSEKLEQMRKGINQARVKIQAIRNIDLGKVGVSYTYGEATEDLVKSGEECDKKKEIDYEEDEPKNVCKICGKQFETSGRLDDHLGEHY